MIKIAAYWMMNFKGTGLKEECDNSNSDDQQ